MSLDPETGGPKTDKDGKPIVIKPKDTDRVFLDVTAYNSRNYYIKGEVYAPGRLPFTGRRAVLDVIHFAGGLRPTADRDKIRLIRSFPKGSPVQVLPIDYDEITMGTDASTNYEILPDDRIVVPRIGGNVKSQPRAGAEVPRRPPEPSESAPRHPSSATKMPPLRTFRTQELIRGATDDGKLEHRLKRNGEEAREHPQQARGDQARSATGESPRESSPAGEPKPTKAR